MSNNIMGSFSSDTTLSTPIAINKGGTGQTTAQAALDALAAASGSLVQGDIFIVDSSGNVVRLARGSDNQTMVMNGNNPNWETVSSGGATVTTQTIAPSAQTTTSTSLVDIANSTITLASRTDGKASWIMYISGRNTTNGENMQLGVYFNGADQEVVATTSLNGGTNGVYTIATTDDLDGGDILGRFAVSSATGTITTGGTANSQVHVFEVS